MSISSLEGVKPSIASLFTQIAGMSGFQATNLWNFMFLSQNLIGGAGHYLTYEQMRTNPNWNSKMKAEQAKSARQKDYDDKKLTEEQYLQSVDYNDDKIDKAEAGFADDDTPAWYTATDTPILTALAQSVSLSFPSIETESTWANYHHIQSYKPISNDFTLTFLENNLMSVTNFFQDWFDEIYDPKKMAFRPGNKKLDGLLMLYAYPLSILEGTGGVGNFLADLPTPTGWYHLEGLLFKGLGGIEANYGSSDLMKVTANFSCDKVHIHRLLG